MMGKFADPIIARADLLYFKGRCDEAVELLTDTLASKPTQVDIVTRLVEILIDSGWHAQALEFIQNNIADDINPYVLLLRGICLEALGNFAFAEDIADQLITQDRQKANALAIKARIAVVSQKNDMAERLFQEAIACDSGCGMAWYGRACLRRQQGDAQAHFDFVRKAFLCSPASRDIAIAFHEGSLSVQKFPQAEAVLSEALSGHRMNRRLRFFLIDLLLRQAKFAEAMTEIESALVDFGVEEGILAAALNIRKKLGPMIVPTNPMPGGSVSLCMIVKNEKDHLARCLRSVKPVVDEIILVDTGSNDETKDIARLFGAQVYDFSWVDDFSKARNFSLSKASGDWIFVLDADETISDKDYEKLKRVLETTQSRPAAFRIQTRNYSNHANTVGFRTNPGEVFEEEGIGWFPSDKVRIFTNDPRIRFEYPVHELVERSLQRLKIPIRDCPVAVHHYGTLQDLLTLKKTKRYGGIGRKKLKKNLKNTAALKELAIQCAQIGNYSEALDLWRRFVGLQPRSAEAYLNMGTACWNLGRYAEACSFAEKALRLDPSIKEAKFNLAYSLLLVGRGGEAKKALEELLKAQPDYLAAQFLLCVAYACLQETAQAENIFGKLRALPIGEYIGESFLDITKRFLSAPRLDYARCTLNAALNFGCGNQELRALLESCSAAA